VEPATDPGEGEDDRHRAQRRPERAQRQGEPAEGGGHPEQDRRARPDRRAGGDAHQERVRERVPEQPLQRHPGHRQARADERGQEHARKAQLPHDAGNGVARQPRGRVVHGRRHDPRQHAVAERARDLAGRQRHVAVARAPPRC
jgi:hypothetical protein